MRSKTRPFFLFFLGYLVFLSGLSGEELSGPLLWKGPPTPIPQKLSEWNIFTSSNRGLDLHPEVHPYELNTPLFSDYALKLRTIWIPAHTSIDYNHESVLDFPEGTILSKTFYYAPEQITFVLPSDQHRQTFQGEGKLTPLQNKHVLETRLLVKTPKGWIGLPYIWNNEQTEATLQVIGQQFSLLWYNNQQKATALTYQVPNMNQCKNCHVQVDQFQRTIKPLGPTGKNLHRLIVNPENDQVQEQLQYLKQFFSFRSWPNTELTNLPRLPAWNDLNASVEKRARSYLAVNCAHCHNAQGPAKNSKLYLSYDTQSPIDYGVCKSPVAAGSAGGGLPFDITPGNPARSLIPFRMNSRLPQVMMPELGRSLIHQEAVDLVSTWIEQMSGTCQN